MLKDLQHQNYPTVTGTPSNILGPLPTATQAIRLSATDTLVVADSVSSSLAVADGSEGGLAMSGWFSLPSLPGSTQTILGKVGSYELKITSAGKLQWILTNGANTVTVTSNTTISTSTWYHFAGVLNMDFHGNGTFGNVTPGTLQLLVPGDYYHGVATASTAYNLQVSKYTCFDQGVLSSVSMDLQCAGDTALAEWIRAVVFEDSSGTPGDLLAVSPDQRLGLALKGVGGGTRYERLWITFPLVGAVYPGPYWIGFEAGESHNNLNIGYETAGGSRAFKHDDHGEDSGTSAPTEDTPSSFGTPAGTDTKGFSVYATYTPSAQTGAEAKALIYLNGVEDNSISYARGIADTANNLQHPAGVAVDLDDWAIFNKKLTPVQVAMHYAAGGGVGVVVIPPSILGGLYGAALYGTGIYG